MSRRPTPKKGQTVHVTLRCQNKAFNLKPSKFSEDLNSWIACLPNFFAIQLHHYVIMSNHFHFLLTPFENNFGDAMCYFTTNVAKFLNYEHDKCNHIFGNRYAATVIGSTDHLMNCIRYIYQNPIRAGIAKSLDDYPFLVLDITPVLVEPV
jgi:REP element-mobilizing transposase RayT